MSRARNWIYYSTIAMVFGAAFYVKIGTFALQSFYVLMLVNLWLMLLMKKLWAPKGLVVFFGFLLCSGAIGIFRNTDTFARIAKEFTGVGICSFYSCCFFRTIDFELEKAFRLYAKMAFWVQIIGITLYPFQYFLIDRTRYHGIMGESSFIAYLGLPALYYYADCWQKKREHGIEILILLLAFVLAQSSTGFIGLGFGIFIFMLRFRRAIVIVPFILCSFFVVVYSLSDGFKERATDTYDVFTSPDVTGTNLSTYVLYTNFYVMTQALKEHPILGNGFNSHGESFTRYIGSIETFGFEGTEYAEYNSEDACSLGIRVASDFGLLGIFLMFWFIWRFRPMGNSELDVMRTAIWLYFFTKIVRGGVYFQNEQYFYICFYALAPMVLRNRAASLIQTANSGSNISTSLNLVTA
jgi:hypothetical protein